MWKGAREGDVMDVQTEQMLRPQVLKPDAQHSLLLQLGAIGGPRSVVLNELGQFNPSPVRAPSEPRLSAEFGFAATGFATALGCTFAKKSN